MQVGKINLLDPATKVGIIQIVPKLIEIEKRALALFTESDLDGVRFADLTLGMIVLIEYVDVVEMADATKVSLIADHLWRRGTVELVVANTGVIVEKEGTGQSPPVRFHKAFVTQDREFERWAATQKKTNQRLAVPVTYILGGDSVKPWAIVVCPGSSSTTRASKQT